ncbi:MAG TPA: NAD(P)-dependent oxidoreductase [Alphaproteobacteria bacterium]|nr:NAD(P)-dependent oxidoreductase [Alphaproteobacteria bacterium]
MPEQPIVLLTNAIHPDGDAILAGHARLVTAPDTSPDTLRSLATDADGIIVRAKLPDDIVSHAPRLKGLVRHGVGLDFIPVPAATAKGIPVANLPGSNTQAVAEYCFAALFHLRRPLGSMDQRLRHEGWGTARALADVTAEVGGTTLGIVGVGTIGRRVATMATHGFGMRVLGASRTPGRMPDGVEEVGLEELFSSADAVILSCALTDETRGLVNGRLVSLMKPNAALVNVSRGAVVETEALIRALRDGAIAGAALDVFETQPLLPDDDLFKSQRLLLTPHVAGITATSMRNMSIGAAEEMLRILRGERPLNLVNPDCFKG